MSKIRYNNLLSNWTLWLLHYIYQISYQLYIMFLRGFFSIWVFFHNHSRITGLQEMREGIFLTPHYHFHPFHRHLDISRAITADSSPLGGGGGDKRSQLAISFNVKRKGGGKMIPKGLITKKADFIDSFRTFHFTYQSMP